MIDFDYVVAIEIAELGENWRYFVQRAAEWLEKNVDGGDQGKWQLLNIASNYEGDIALAIGFLEPSKMRMFELWCNLQGAPTRYPETVKMKLPYASHSSEIHVNTWLELDDTD